MKALIKTTAMLALTVTIGSGCIIALGNTSECDKECCKKPVKKECCPDKKK